MAEQAELFAGGGARALPVLERRGDALFYALDGARLAAPGTRVMRGRPDGEPVRRLRDVVRLLVAGKELYDPAALARLVEATVGGSLLSWAVHQEGPAADWVLRDVKELIAPHRRLPRPRGRVG